MEAEEITKQILKERAKVLATVKTEVVDNSVFLPMVSFKLLNETYCIESSYVREVLPLKDIIWLPGTPDFVEGVVNIRGQIISILSLKKILGFRLDSSAPAGKIIVLGDTESDMEFGILTDHVIGSYRLNSSLITQAPQNLSGSGKEYIQGLSPEGQIVLNAKILLSDKLLIVNSSKKNI